MEKVGDKMKAADELKEGNELTPPRFVQGFGPDTYLVITDFEQV